MIKKDRAHQRIPRFCLTKKVTRSGSCTHQRIKPSLFSSIDKRAPIMLMFLLTFDDLVLPGESREKNQDDGYEIVELKKRLRFGDDVGVSFLIYQFHFSLDCFGCLGRSKQNLLQERGQNVHPQRWQARSHSKFAPLFL